METAYVLTLVVSTRWVTSRVSLSVDPVSRGILSYTSLGVKWDYDNMTKDYFLTQ